MSTEVKTGPTWASPYRRGRRHRSQHLGLMPQHVDVGDVFPAVGEHHRDIAEYMATVMDRAERAPGHRRGQLLHQPCPLRHKPQRDAAHVGGHADTIAGN